MAHKSLPLFSVRWPWDVQDDLNLIMINRFSILELCVPISSRVVRALPWDIYAFIDDSSNKRKSLSSFGLEKEFWD